MIDTLGGDLGDLPDVTDPNTDWLRDVQAYQLLARQSTPALPDLDL